MGKIDVSYLRYLTKAEIRVLLAIEICMRNHEFVPGSLAASIANLRGVGVHRILQDLCREKLLCYERGKKYDGYRLTNLGYDYLALSVFIRQDIINSFGNQIGVGKESNIYTVANEADEIFCLKLHRLGRTCFRNIKAKRDYHKHKNSISWLNLSRISAKKEFAYMTALYNRGFPVPKPIAYNRHCVLMEHIDGVPLINVIEVKDVEKLYDELMNLIVQLAECGVIHGDFNEFNIMLTEDEKPIVIDFPQMVSTLHANAEMYFDRDVECIQKLFRKKFNYDSRDFPKYEDIERSDKLDAEVGCSGFTKKMAKVIDRELGIIEEGDDDSEDEEENESASDECELNKIEKPEQFSQGREKSDELLHADFEKKINISCIEEPSCSSQNICSYKKNAAVERWLDSSEGAEKPEDEPETTGENADSIEQRISASDENDLDLLGSVFKFTPVEAVVRRNEELKMRLMKQARSSKIKEQRKMVKIKGKASARTRTRKNNMCTIKDSMSGCSVWE